MKHIIKVEVLENLPEIRPLIAMDKNKKFFAEGKKEPVGPADNEIWYWGEYYDLGNVISMFGQELPYKGQNILSNEQVGDKYVITFDDSVTKIGLGVISEDSAELYPVFINIPESGILCNINKVSIPNSVSIIGNDAFARCSSLTSVTIGKSVTSIGESAFYNCSSLPSITIPNSVTSIGESAFDGCSGLTSVTIPNSVTSIGDYAFYKCSSLTSVTIPNSVTSIGKGAFSGCSSLTSITIPNSVTSIGVGAFGDCYSLTSVTIPNSVTSIGYTAFHGCSSLTSVTIPNSVTSIGDYAFNGCTSLSSIVCEAITPPVLSGTSVFDNSNVCPIYVPSQSVDAYKTTENWPPYANRIVGLLNNNQIRYTRSS